MRPKHLVPTLALITTLVAGLPAHLEASASLDVSSPTVTLCGAGGADFYNNVAPGTGGCDVGGFPVLDVAAASYGLVFGDDTDGASNNEVDPGLGHLLLFSVDQGAVGIAGTPVNNQAARLQAAGDIFRTLNSPSNPPAGAIAAGACLPGTTLVPGHALQNNQPDHNFIPTIGPGAINGFGAVDELDALEIGGFDVDHDGVRDRPVYFTLDRFSPSLGAFSPAAIFLAPVGVPAFGVFAPRPALGLRPGDNVDALAIWDRNVIGTMEAGLDYALFSLDPNSPTLAGPDMIWGTGDDLSPGDVFLTDFSGTFCLYVQHNWLGLMFYDNLDALDVIALQ